MDAVTMLRDLWRHRFAVVGVLALSVLAGLLVLYAYSPPLQLQSRKYEVGVATTRVLIDTPSSQVAAIAPEGSGELGLRADLLSRIMVEGTVKAEIAKAAGLHPNALFGVSMSALDQPVTPTPPRGAPVLTTQVVENNDSTQLPLIQIEAQAPDTAFAARLADAAVKGLRDYVDEQAADTSVPDSRRVRVTPLGDTQAETVARGPNGIFALVAALFVFGLGCACILGVAAVVRGWRRATAAEHSLPEDGVDELDDPSPSAVSPLRQPDTIGTEPRVHAGRRRRSVQ